MFFCSKKLYPLKFFLCLLYLFRHNYDRGSNPTCVTQIQKPRPTTTRERLQPKTQQTTLEAQIHRFGPGMRATQHHVPQRPAPRPDLACTHVSARLCQVSHLQQKHFLSFNSLNRLDSTHMIEAQLFGSMKEILSNFHSFDHPEANFDPN